MATGWPMKTTYANGDVYSASDVNDITGTINLLQTNTLSSQAGKNRVINGGMDIWQRGTSISAAASTTPYTADRWQIKTNANQACTISRQATGDTTNLPNIQYCMRYQRNSGQTGTGTMYLANQFESIESIPFAGKAVTYSFYARKGSNYSPTSSILGVTLYGGTGTDQNIVTGAYTGGTSISSNNATLTTTWQRFTYTATVGATITELSLFFSIDMTGTAGTNDYFEVTGVQIELGSYATTFSRAGGSIQGELAACQRYYYRQSAVESFSDFGLGFAISTTSARIEVSMPVTMRIAATSLEYSTLILYDGSGTNVAVTSAALGEVNLQRLRLTIGVASGLTQYRPYSLLANNSTSAYVGFSAEL